MYSNQLKSLVTILFFKYYNQGKEAKTTDFADLHHLYCIPYCHLAVVERDMCHVLNQIKNRHPILNGVFVKNIDFFNDLVFKS